MYTVVPKSYQSSLPSSREDIGAIHTSPCPSDKSFQSTPLAPILHFKFHSPLYSGYHHTSSKSPEDPHHKPAPTVETQPNILLDPLRSRPHPDLPNHRPITHSPSLRCVGILTIPASLQRGTLGQRRRSVDSLNARPSKSTFIQDQKNYREIILRSPTIQLATILLTFIARPAKCCQKENAL